MARGGVRRSGGATGQINVKPKLKFLPRVKPQHMPQRQPQHRPQHQEPKGQWMFIPASTNRKPGKQGPFPTVAPWKLMKGGGKGIVGKGGSRGALGKGRVIKQMKIQKGSGKGTGRGQKVPNVELDKLQKLDAKLKVWVGGLDGKTSWKKIREHFKDVGKAKVALMNKGKACVAFDTPEEVSNAIATFNGSEIGGKAIEVDVWTQKEKKERQPGERKHTSGGEKKKLGALAIKTAEKRKAGKAGKGADGPSRFWEKLKKMDISCKVKVSNLPADIDPKKLKQHFTELDAKCSVLEIMTKEKGTACVGFETADQADNAIAIVADSDLGGSTLDVSPWTAPPGRYKKKNGE